jgi:hypothetical protein
MAELQDREHIHWEDLSAYADGQIADPTERRRIERHLEVCEECRHELRQLQSISRMLADLPEPELPRSFRLSPEDVPVPAAPTPIEPWFIRYQSPVRVAAMAAVLLLVAVVTIDLLPDSTVDEGEMPVMMDAPQEEVVTDSPDDAEAPEVRGVEEDAEDAPGEGTAPAPEDAPAVDRDQDTAEAPQEEAVEEDQDEPAAEADPEERADAEIPRELLAHEQPSEGLSTLRMIAIGLGVVSLVLLTVGFVIPRRWSSSAQRS